MKKKILIVRKMSPLEYYYKGNHKSKELAESNQEQLKNLKKIENILKRKFEYDIITRKDLSETLVNHYDYVISAGGDGTVIATAAYNKNTPQLNLKLDKRSKGNLCCKNMQDSLKKMLDGDYELEEWTRQEVYLDKEFVGRALNETCVGENMDFAKMARYQMLFSLENKSTEEYQANSGLIIVTGTGSTGWPSAFEGYSRKDKFFKFRTVLPVTGLEKGMGDYFSILYKGHEGKFSLDTIGRKIPRDSLLEIKLSKYPLKVIVTK